MLSQRERNHLRASLLFFEYAGTTLPYHPTKHPKIRALFDTMAPLTIHEARVLAEKLKDPVVSLTLDMIARLTGESKVGLGRKYAKAGIKGKKVYPLLQDIIFIDCEIFGENYDLTDATEKT